MNTIQKSEAIKNSLRNGFQDGSSKMAKRKCYGYEVGSDGELTVNPNEARIVCWIFEQYLAGKSLGKIAAGLEKQGILSPTSRPKWNREAIDKLLSNEKYTGRVLLQKTVSTGAVQTENNGFIYYTKICPHTGNFDDLLLIGFDKSHLEDQNHLDRMEHFFLYDYRFERI